MVRAFQNAHSCSVLICRFWSLYLAQTEPKCRPLSQENPCHCRATDVLSSYSFVKNGQNFKLLFDENLSIYHSLYTFWTGAGNFGYPIACIKTNARKHFVWTVSLIPIVPICCRSKYHPIWKIYFRLFENDSLPRKIVTLSSWCDLKPTWFCVFFCTFSWIESA